MRGEKGVFFQVVNPLGDPAWGVFIFVVEVHKTFFKRNLKKKKRFLCFLYESDDPVSVVRRYVQRHAKPGDMVTIGETPLAVMQGGETPNHLFHFMYST